MLHLANGHAMCNTKVTFVDKSREIYKSDFCLDKGCFRQQKYGCLWNAIGAFIHYLSLKKKYFSLEKNDISLKKNDFSLTVNIISPASENWKRK